MGRLKRKRTYSLAGKVVFLTGAGGGLGTATAAALTQRGARVALADIDLCAAKRSAQTLPRGQALPVDCDVTATDSVRAAVSIAEVEQLVPVGEIPPEEVATPGIYVKAIVQGERYERRIERRVVRKQAP